MTWITRRVRGSTMTRRVTVIVDCAFHARRHGTRRTAVGCSTALKQESPMSFLAYFAGLMALLSAAILSLQALSERTDAARPASQAVHASKAAKPVAKTVKGDAIAIKGQADRNRRAAAETSRLTPAGPARSADAAKRKTSARRSARIHSDHWSSARRRENARALQALEHSRLNAYAPPGMEMYLPRRP
jgi:hypothetical protein